MSLLALLYLKIRKYTFLDAALHEIVFPTKGKNVSHREENKWEVGMNTEPVWGGFITGEKADYVRFSYSVRKYKFPARGPIRCNGKF